jgi:hypothetical protein
MAKGDSRKKHDMLRKLMVDIKSFSKKDVGPDLQCGYPYQ